MCNFSFFFTKLSYNVPMKSWSFQIKALSEMVVEMMMIALLAASEILKGATQV